MAKTYEQGPGAGNTNVFKVRVRAGDGVATAAAVTSTSDRHLERLRKDAFALHQAGAFDQARALYEEALALQPQDGEILGLLGVLDHQAGAFEASVDRLNRALTIGPSAETYSNLALSLLKLSRFAEAEAACRRSLGLAPHRPEAHQSLGGALYAQGRSAEAAEAFAAAAALAPGRSDLHIQRAASLLAAGDAPGALAAADEAGRLDADLATAPFYRGGALAALGRLEEACHAYDEALKLDPLFGSAAENLGAVLRRLGRAQGAAEAYGRALEADPNRLSALIMRAGLLIELGRYDEAVEPARRAHAQDPANAEGRLMLGLALVETRSFAEGAAMLEAAPPDGAAALARYCALATAYKESFAFDKALEACRGALTVDLDRARGLARLGGALEDAGRHGEAARACLRALELDPACREAAVNLAAARIEEGRLGAALRALVTALTIAPDDPVALSNLGVALYRQGRTQEAITAFDRALRDGGAPSHRFSYALALLKSERFEEGWAAFEARREVRGAAVITRTRPLPSWSGELRPDAVLLLEAEQGLGDTLQCLRFLPQVRARVGAVRIKLQEPLRRLCGSGGAPVATAEEILLNEDDLGGAAVYAPLFSLPGIFVPTGKEIAGKPYLAPPPDALNFWASRRPQGRLRVGVVWQGNPAAAVERGRSFPLEIALSALTRPGVDLVSLQKDHGLHQAEAPCADGRLLDLGEAYEIGDFAETAGMLSTLDLVVTCDTAVAHLAGAIGAPTFLALNRVCDWRWGESGDRTRWYDSVRLFRQGPSGDWAEVFAAMARAISTLMEAQGAGGDL